MPEPTLKRANAIRYCFDDPDLDFMFQWAAGAAKTGGLDPGELFYIASGMDGTAASWVDRFDEFGDTQRELAADWIGRGRRRSAGEALMKAYSGYRMAWLGGPHCPDLRRRHRLGQKRRLSRWLSAAHPGPHTDADGAEGGA
jgi:hypothetical protein